MAIISYGKITLEDRGYKRHAYTVERYERSGKINIRVSDMDGTIFLKMSTEEAKDLIVRLQYAIHEAGNG